MIRVARKTCTPRNWLTVSGKVLGLSEYVVAPIASRTPYRVMHNDVQYVPRRGLQGVNGLLEPHRATKHPLEAFGTRDEHECTDISGKVGNRGVSRWF